MEGEERKGRGGKRGGERRKCRAEGGGRREEGGGRWEVGGGRRGGSIKIVPSSERMRRRWTSGSKLRHSQLDREKAEDSERAGRGGAQRGYPSAASRLAHHPSVETLQHPCIAFGIWDTLVGRIPQGLYRYLYLTGTALFPAQGLKPEQYRQLISEDFQKPCPSPKRIIL